MQRYSSFHVAQLIMDYEGTIIRPPSEAHSIILQVTAGCSHNKCIFCGAYKDKKFRIRYETIDSDIDFASKYCTRQKKVFLADGDALIIPHEKLLSIFEKINTKLPWVNRISLYGSCKSIRSKTKEQLLQLKELGLHRVYTGLESGDREVLDFVKKGESPESMIEAAEKINDSGLFLSVTVLLGIAGQSNSTRHAIETAKVLSLMNPKQVAALTVMVIPGTKLHTLIENGEFEMMGSFSILKELKEIIANISLEQVQFFSNHASNYLQLSGRLPRDKEKMITEIDRALQGERELVKEEFRAL